MNHRQLLVKSLLLALGMGIALSDRQATADETNLPLNDQVRFIGELESRSYDDWNFSSDENIFSEETYQLQMSQPDIRLIEQDLSTWGNDGSGRDYAILVEVYDSNEE
ncbi:hypothetical protein [Myxosarcina sp. GI1(2024)]